MRIQWDSALVAATAKALDHHYHGVRIQAYLLDPGPRRFLLFLKTATLAWELHPTRLGLRILEPAEAPPEARRLPAKLRGVWAPADDRILVLETRRIRGRPPGGRIILELLPNQENVVVTEGEDHVVRVLLRTREGERTLRRGQPYAFPTPSNRAGATGDLPPKRWLEVLGTGDERERRRRLLSGVAWSSPMNAPFLLGEAGYEAWRELVARVGMASDPGAQTGPGALPGPDTLPPGWVVTGRHGPQPYPLPLPERTLSETPDVLAAFRQAAERSEESAAAEALLIPGPLLERLDKALEAARGRVARLEEELHGLDDPAERQGWGDLLLARFHQVPEGADEVELDGFDGDSVRIPLDPTLSPDANARRHYDRAARLRRAAEELPGRIRDARTRWETLEALKDGVAGGTVGREELEAALPPTTSGSTGDGGGPTLPFRLYRSSGGYEIRVGRGAARNDDLTFHHARPDDIWLHARHTAGAHVILRWDGDGSPPPRDLREAAVLAALYSKARTSGSVPVDWTRRKHVRKPRKAAPGAVVPQQVKTVFVAPDEAVEERLRED